MIMSSDEQRKPTTTLTPNELDILHRMRAFDKGEGCHAEVRSLAREYAERPGRSVSHVRSLLARLRRKGVILFTGVHAARGTNVYLIPGHHDYDPKRVPAVDPLRTDEICKRYSKPSKRGAPFDDRDARAILKDPRLGGASIPYRGVMIPSSIHRNYGERTWKQAVEALLATYPMIDGDGRRYGPKGPVKNQSKLLRHLCEHFSAQAKEAHKSPLPSQTTKPAKPTEPPTELPTDETVADMLASLPGYKPTIYKPAAKKTEPVTTHVLTVRHLVEREYALRELRTKKLTAAEYAKYRDRLIKHLGTLPAASCGPDQVLSYLATRKAEADGKSRMVSLKREVDLLKSALMRAYRAGDLTRDPKIWWPDFKAPVTPRRVYIKSIEDFNAISKQLTGYKKRWLWWATLTGGDYGELLNVTMADCDLERNLLHIPGTKARSRDRIIPLHPALAASLRKRNLKSSDPILRKWFARPKDLARACKAAGLDYVVTLKDCRRTFATWAARAGIPRNEVAALLGHSPGSPITDRHYCVPEPSRYRDKLDKLLQLQE